MEIEEMYDEVKQVVGGLENAAHSELTPPYSARAAPSIR